MEHHQRASASNMKLFLVEAKTLGHVVKELLAMEVVNMTIKKPSL
jgi:hypothetical protein